jgi:transposase
MSIKECTVLVGIDWADRKHVCAVKYPEAKIAKIENLLQSSTAIDDWVMKLKARSDGGKIAIALEQSRGGLIFALMKYEFIVLYPINPATVAKYRETWKTSGPKDDPFDALLILELLEDHNKKLTAWYPEPKDIRLLQRLTEYRTKLVQDLKRVGNKVTTTVKEYYPVILELFPRIYRDITADFLIAFPTLIAAQSATDKELTDFFRTQGAGGEKRISKRIALIRESSSLVEDEAIIESNALFVKPLALQLKAINKSISEYEEKIEAVYETLPNKKLFNSLPSSGEVSAPRLLAALGTNRKKFNSSDDLACYSGIAPVIEQSGKQCWVHWRYRCNKVVRQAFVEWAFLSVRTSFWAKAFYSQQRAKGKTHCVAIRALAFKWLSIIFKIWKIKFLTLRLSI